ncbi:TPA: DUF488 domain-containing protein [Staphylococcus aureus]|nr:DUF488 domain-containing protein [Staphylococcus aureus]HDA4737780.1 DUF488 domain-containing protein [Staphylococcus aureus]HDC5590347.1 DUF488 domain-containing protein [Staphylococcus aureus]
MTVDIGRIYDNKDNTDAIRILVDRVWPRGISKRTANLDYWLKDIAPSTELRQWFQHDPKLYGAFKEKYEKELRDNETQKEAFEKLKAIVNQHHHVLLLYSAKDTKHNQAVVLQQLLNTYIYMFIVDHYTCR